MDASRVCRIGTIALALSLTSACALVSPARGDALRGWSGASARAGADSRDGATAAASDQWSRRIEYSSRYSPGMGGYFVVASGSSAAEAGGSAEALLRVQTQ